MAKYVSEKKKFPFWKNNLCSSKDYFLLTNLTLRFYISHENKNALSVPLAHEAEV